MGLPIRIPTHGWRQVGGDVDPGAHGGIIAAADGTAIEIREIQPVRAFVGDGEAQEVGYPFWSREGYYDANDLDTDRKEVQNAMRSSGLTEDDLRDLTPNQRAMAIAEILLSYGSGADEGPSGWSEDVVPGRVKWFRSKGSQGASYLADEDDEFRTEIMGLEANPHMSWGKYLGG